MLLADLVATSQQLTATRSRSAKVQVVADVLRRCDPEDLPIAVHMLGGRLRQRRTGLGYASLGVAAAPAQSSTITIADVDEFFALSAMTSGTGSVDGRRHAWRDLLSRATHDEQQLLRSLVTGDVRQGAAVGVLTEAVAVAAEVSSGEVRRAVTMAGDVFTVAEAVLTRGAPALAEFTIQPGRALAPMLAGSAPDVATALERTGAAQVDWKLDGVRVQAHVVGPADHVVGPADHDSDSDHADDSDPDVDPSGWRVRLFTRSLEDITDRAPQVVAALARVGHACILDGELLSLNAGGTARPFQETAARVATRSGPGDVLGDDLTFVAFDVLHHRGEALVDRPLDERRRILEAIVTVDLLGVAGDDSGRTLADGVPDRLMTVPMLRCPRGVGDTEPAAAFAADALARGHEGVLVKAAQSTYTSGRRGSAWIKVKPRETLDLVVLAVEWGSGRRQGLLSNLHLGARDAAGDHGAPGGFVMLGKTFKGLTDAMLAWQTRHLLDLSTSTGQWVVHVRPELVVEVAFDGVQSSSRYPTGMTLRFARVVRHRPDKAAADANTVAELRAIHQRRTDSNSGDESAAGAAQSGGTARSSSPITRRPKR